MVISCTCRRQDRSCRLEIPFVGDLQAWIRNSNLAPDWLRIGADIVGGATPPTFSMTFSLAGEGIPQAGTPGRRTVTTQPSLH